MRQARFPSILVNLCTILPSNVDGMADYKQEAFRLLLMRLLGAVVEMAIRKRPFFQEIGMKGILHKMIDCGEKDPLESTGYHREGNYIDGTFPGR